MGLTEKVAEILLENNAISVDTVNPFKFASGLMSPIYVDCRLLISNPTARKSIVRFLADSLKDEKADILVGAGNMGIPFAAYLAEEMDSPMVFVRAKPKEHGKGEQIEGKIQKGQHAVVISDMITTDPVLKESIRAVKNAGAVVDRCAAVYTHRLAHLDNFFEEEKVPVQALCDLKTLLTVALIKKHITDEEKDVIEEWQRDPAAWNERRLQNISEKKMEEKEKIAETLLKIEAITLSPAKPYKFTSGILSPIYTDNRLLMSHPKQWKEIINAMERVIKEEIGLRNIDAIAGVASAGIPHAAKLAERLNLPMFYVKSATEDFGKKKIIEGNLGRGARVVVLEDLVSTGGSAIKAANAVRENGGIVTDCLVIFTYEMGDARKGFEEVNIKLHPLTDITTLLEVAAKSGYISDAEKQTVMDWTKDNKGWGAKMGFEKAASAL